MELGKLGYIDAARGDAILMVVLVHHVQAVTRMTPLDSFTSLIGAYGQMGVQLFFVASAITLCMSQSRRVGGGALGPFYIRRFFRIAPLYYSAILLYAVVDLLAPRAFGAYSPGNVVANLTFLHGFVPSAINDVVPGGWSIAGEMAFYVVFPFAFALAEQAYRRWGAAPLAWMAALIFALYVAAWHVIPLVTPFEIARNNIFYYWPPAHVVVFAIGMAAFFLTRNGRRTPLWVDLVGFAVPTVISLALWNSAYPAAFAIIPGCSAVSFAFLINLLARIPFDAERPSAIEVIGRVSYSMYVLHFLVVWFVAPPLISAVASVIGSPVAVLLATFPLVVLIAFCAAWVSERFVERPGIDLGRRLIQRARRQPVPA